MNDVQPRFLAAVHHQLDRALVDFSSHRPVLVALDFDGVLAPLIDDPTASAPLPDSVAALAQIATVEGVEVVLVSGRDAEDLAGRSGVPAGTRIIGSHGAQWARVSEEGSPEAAVIDPLELDEDQRVLLAELSRRTEEIADGVEGAWVQRKPAAVVLHTRTAGTRGVEVTEATTAGPAALDGVHTVVGKDVVEMSVLHVTKGDALLRLREQLGAEAVLYAGDDTTDEYAFATLDSGRGDVSIKVGDGDTGAAYRVDTPAEITVVLHRLLELLRAGS
ncbi:trehalose-phosphatase [Bogoriella caseilytica]|uniref:Trehalose 6-phosphate phosphatase n=1 Tax=Bogoriella caseilytica TaxID=56055 RepID=A0A3N2BDZ3_9MICO|nr:trehalose-phosphatase [Bogoriella caseilytica]ROR73254.1 trehalose 6-phosphatase [Bogoriella caseilytica]